MKDRNEKILETIKESIEEGRKDYREGRTCTSKEVRQLIKEKFPLLK